VDRKPVGKAHRILAEEVEGGKEAAMAQVSLPIGEIDLAGLEMLAGPQAPTGGGSGSGEGGHGEEGEK
jgi:hypothetical protein